MSLDTSWHFVVGTWNGTTVKMYVDGVNGTDGFISGNNLATNNAPVHIGTDYYNNAPNTYPFNGTIDEVKIYNRSLSSEQIYQMYLDSIEGYSNSSTIVSDEFSGGENWTCEVTPNDGKVDGLLKGVSLILDFVNETLGRDAILEGANNSLNVSYNIYTDLEVDISYLDLNQTRGSFDFVVDVGDQFFAFNYVTENESYTNIDDSIGNAFNVLEMSDMSYESIVSGVENFISSKLN